MDVNGSMIRNGSDQAWCQPVSSNIGQILAYVSIFIFSLVGNLLIGAVFYRTRHPRTTVDIFIFNMACSDLLFALTVAPRKITELLSTPPNQGQWYIDGLLGEALCKLAFMTQDVTTAVSIESLVVIAVDRFRCIVFPLKPNFVTPSVRGILILLTWIVALGFHSPYIYIWRLITRETKTFCRYSWTPRYDNVEAAEAYFLTLSILLFIIPLFVMIVLYTIIIVSLRRRQFTMLNSSRLSRESWNKRNKSVLRTIIAVVMVFVITWLPFNVMAHLTFFSSSSISPCFARTLNIALILAHSNNAINPYVIFAFSKNYRDRLKQMLCCIRTSSCTKTTQNISVINFDKMEINPTDLKTLRSPSSSGIQRTNSNQSFNTRL